MSPTERVTSEVQGQGLLPEDMLREFRGRAAEYDRENTFFTSDLEDLQAGGYLAAPVPTELGGGGMGLEDLVVAQRRLAAHAPATALGVNMHLVWMQVARFLHDRKGDEEAGPLDWVMRDAVDGEIFGFGISEAGNDAVLLDAFSEAAEHESGGYTVRGTKVFTTLSPVWTRLGVHAKDSSRGDDGTVVFGFVRRDARGVRGADDGAAGLSEGAIRHPGVWNPLGMRATQSWVTELDGVRILPDDVAAEMSPFDPTEPLILAIFTSFSLLTASVYAGIADRAIELATESALRESDDGIRLDDPDTASKLTEAILDHRRSLDALTVLARDVDRQQSRDDWFFALAACRNQVCDEARRAVDIAMRFVGSRGYQADSELARLYRDVLAGMFHPSSSRALANTLQSMLRA